MPKVVRHIAGRLMAVACFAVLVGCPTDAAAQSGAGARFSDAVTAIQVHGFECGPKKQKRVQSGFIGGDLPGIKGPVVITALHGVLGCKTLLAESNESGLILNDLVKLAVDVERDVIVLSSDKLTGAVEKKKVLMANPVSVDQMGQNIYVKGFAGETPRSTVRPLSVDDTRKILNDVIPPSDALVRLRSRGSPSLTLPVVTVAGPIQPGDSGAPIIDARGAVAAVGDGGLTALKDFGWAFPYRELRPVRYSEASVIVERLDREGSNPELFSFVVSPVRLAALRPSVTFAYAASSKAPDEQLMLTLPFRLGGQRISLTVAGGSMTRQSATLVNTLPGIPPFVNTTKERHGYWDAGITYHPRRLPKGMFDPYVRGSAGMIDGKTGHGLVSAVGGLDLLVGGPVTTFLETGVRSENVPTTTIMFNRYGNGTEAKDHAWIARSRVMIGVRVALGAWVSE